MVFALLVRGDRACFRRPEFATDLVSYDVITPIAARRLFEKIYGPRSIRWVVERIAVLHPIRMQWLEIPDLVRPDRSRRIYALHDVAYVVVARLELVSAVRAEQEAENHKIAFQRRMENEGHSQQPFLGLTGFVANVTLMENVEVPPTFVGAKTSLDLGWMLYDTDGTMSSRARFFRAALIDGMMTVPDPASEIFAS